MHEAHGLSMTDQAQRTCQCGAVYARNEQIAPMREISSYQCLICKRTMENWNSAWVPVYRLIVRPIKSSDSTP
jgi:hypothetical protein